MGMQVIQACQGVNVTGKECMACPFAKVGSMGAQSQYPMADAQIPGDVGDGPRVTTHDNMYNGCKTI